ncbi:hypothetical protein [Metabacillus fastidiosus]|uniref:hypothetical protein n=1 Tax=Metabacillus fastidiosus TaxID=1458 RepID=UPI002E1F5AEA|nr:hypothetical protein [Metabacillus fastidiosus]
MNENKSKLAVFIGYDIPSALDAKWNIIIPKLNQRFEMVDYEGDNVHVVNNEEEITMIENLVEGYNRLLEINLTLEVFEIDG